MEENSTYCKKKIIKREKPAQRAIQCILNYSKSIDMIRIPFGKVILLVNN